MASMGDRLSGLGKTLKKHLDKVFIAAMLGTFLFNLFLWFSESQTFQYDPPPPQRTEPKVQISREKPVYMAVKSLAQPLPEFDTSEYKILVDFNMFDPKAQKDTEALTQDADKLVEQGKTALAAGNLDEAESLAKRAQSVLPTHKPAKDLLAEIQKAREEAAKAAASPKGKPGAPGAKPAPAAGAKPAAGTPAPGGTPSAAPAPGASAGTPGTAPAAPPVPAPAAPPPPAN